MRSSSIALRKRSAISIAPESGVLGMTTVNSSPPYRAAKIGLAPKRLSDRLGDRPQAFVALLMPVGVVVEFETVDVDHQQRQRQLIAARSARFLRRT